MTIYLVAYVRNRSGSRCFSLSEKSEVLRKWCGKSVYLEACEREERQFQSSWDNPSSHFFTSNSHVHAKYKNNDGMQSCAFVIQAHLSE